MGRVICRQLLGSLLTYPDTRVLGLISAVLPTLVVSALFRAEFDQYSMGRGAAALKRVEFPELEAVREI